MWNVTINLFIQAFGLLNILSRKASKFPPEILQDKKQDWIIEWWNKSFMWMIEQSGIGIHLNY